MSDQCPGLPGDIVIFPRTSYNHYAVNVGRNYIVHVTSISDNPGSLDIAGICCLTSEKLAEVKKEKFNDFKQPYDKPYVETDWNGETPLENSEVVKRALSKVGEKGYSVLLKNCEHFAHWCRYDKEVSDQADGIVTAAYVAGAAGVLGGIAYAISRPADKQSQ